eukprot:1502442-Amphidinium_carterae.1
MKRRGIAEAAWLEPLHGAIKKLPPFQSAAVANQAAYVPSLWGARRGESPDDVLPGMGAYANADAQWQNSSMGGEVTGYTQAASRRL